MGITLGITGALWFVSPVVSGFVFVVATATIAFRGYLIPGTPRLTRRYLPNRILRLFGKAPATEQQIETNGGSPFSPKRVLTDVGVVTECTDRDDLCLSDSFRSEWWDSIERFRRHPNEQRAQLAELVEVPADAISLHENEDGAVYAEVDGNPVGQWLSDEALTADLAAASVLESYDGPWSTLDAAHKGTVLSVLRVFLERCPGCDGDVVTAEESEDSCCWSQTALTVGCRDCETLLYRADSAAFRQATRD